MFPHFSSRAARWLILAAGAASPWAMGAAGPGAMSDVAVRMDHSALESAPFPSDRYTVFDGSQRSLRRVNLPKPDCALRPSDCADLDVINALDGFSTQPRITVPFTGDIDPASVSSETVYLVNLGDTFTLRGFGERVGINRIVWEPASRTLSFQSDQLLAEHSRYLLVVTDGVRDTRGRRIRALGAGIAGHGLGHDRDAMPYRHELKRATDVQRMGRLRIAGASLFTTQSISADLVKIHRQIKQSTPAPVDFGIGQSAAGAVRAVFPVAGLQGIQFNRQTGTAPAFTASFVPSPALSVVPGAVGQVAYGRFRSPDYQTAGKVIPATGTLSGVPLPQGANDLLVQVFLPAGPKPARGWPVAMFGHGFTDSMFGAPWTVASVLASRGIATVSLNVVGHGGGALGTLNVLQTGAAPVVVPAGGRGIDQDGNGTIDSTEGVNAAATQSIVGSRDGLRQTVVDYMQLVRQIEAGVDVDGDGASDLDAGRIYYAGQSFGGIYGTILLGVESSIRAGVPNVPGGSIAEIARLSPSFRLLTAIALATRVPSLINLPPAAGLPFPANLAFDENLPLRDEAVRIDTVPGAAAIQTYLDRSQWVTQAGNPVSYAPFIRQSPLPGRAPKPVILQFAKGDLTVPNPTTSAILRAGGLADRATYFRNDLAYALNSDVGRNPHVFLTNIGNPAAAAYAVGAQTQIAVFFATDGAQIIDPDAAGPFFEVPIAGALPETLNYLP